MAFSSKQQDYFNNATHRWNVKSGATRSGKTYMDYFVIPKRIRSMRGKDGLVVLLGNTQTTLQRNIIEPLQKIWTTALVSDIRSDNTALLFGERVYCIGADKKNQAERLRGSSIKYCYGDEVVTWHEDVFQMLKSRLDRSYSRFDGTCNPEGPKHWFKQFLDSDADIYQQSYAIDDNPFNDPTFVANLKREYAGTVYYDRFIRGQWVHAEGLIYADAAAGKGVVPTILRDYQRYYISMDYGTLNPTSMGLWGLCDDVWYRIEEYYYSGRMTGKQLTDEDYYKALEKLAVDRSIQAVIIDPSAASFIACIRKHGHFRVRQADNAVLDGIRSTAVALNTGKIAINDCCKAAINEFSQYRWDDRYEDDRPIKEHDHAMDDMRYFVNTVLRKWLRRG